MQSYITKKGASSLRRTIIIFLGILFFPFMQSCEDQPAGLLDTEEQRNREEIIIQEYLAENDIEAQRTASGLYYYFVEQTDDNERPEPPDSVTVHYTGRELDGNIFDSSVFRDEPFGFRIGLGRVIDGWDEGLELMSRGDKAVLIIPSHLAYGADGVQDPSTRTFRIRPYSTLIFDIELLNISR